jgi:hypothetical protein
MPCKIEYQYCACCGHALDVIEQQVIRLHILVTCNNEACPMFGFTDSAVEHEANAAQKVCCAGTLTHSGAA